MKKQRKKKRVRPMINMYYVNKYLLIADSMKKTLESWDEKLDSFTKTYMDSPWAGMVIFLVLLVFGYIAINGYMKKR